MPPTLTAEERRTIRADDPALEDEADAEEDTSLDDLLKDLFPEPDVGDIIAKYAGLKTDWNATHSLVELARDNFYQRTDTPEKWKRDLEDGRRIYSRLSLNEIFRVVANQCRNAPRFNVPIAETGKGGPERSKQQTRWANSLITGLERSAREALRRKLVDSQLSTGRGILWLFPNEAYENVEFDYRVDADGNMETEKEYLERTEKALIGAGLPWGARVIDPTCYFPEAGIGGDDYVCIVENKPYRQVYHRAVSKHGRAYVQDELRLPRPGLGGWPTSTQGLLLQDQAIHVGAAYANSTANGVVECITYYDRLWYAYIVGGHCIDGPRLHGHNRIPIFELKCLITSSPNRVEECMGITQGMLHIERAIDDLLTLAVDTAYRFSTPKLVVETAVDGRLALGADRQPKTYNFSDPKRVEQLLPGQSVRDVTKDFTPVLQTEILGLLQAQWQRSGLNPIAQGQSPGADPAGYTVNTLQSAALSPYEGPADNEARFWEEVVDFVRADIRGRVKERVYLDVPMDDRRGGTEWLGLGPDDVDQTPSVCTIDPLSDQQRMAMAQWLMSGNQAGYVTRERVQRTGFGIEDTLAEDHLLAVEELMKRLAAVAQDEAIMEVKGPEEQVLPGGPEAMAAAASPQGVPPLPPGQGPAPPEAPSVGAAPAQASQMLTAQGQVNGAGPQTYAPPPPQAGFNG